MADAKIRAVITADDRASRVLRGVGGGIRKLGKLAGLAAIGGFAALGAGAVLATKAFVEQEKQETQLNAVLKSTKNAAGLTATEIKKMATSLQQSTTFGDEAVLSGQNLLLTFTKIGKDIFPEATETMLDMSQALGQDMKSSAVQLGKALNDPVLGVSALSRVGIQFTESQKDTIKTLVKAGDTLGAQKIILKELKTEFGGSAKAARKTFGGAMIALKNTVGDAMETIGSKVAEALEGPITKLGKWFENNGPLIERVVDMLARGVGMAFNLIFDVVKTVFNWIRKNGPGILNQLRAAWDFLKPSIDNFIKVLIEDFIPALRELWNDVLVPLIATVGIALVGALKMALDALTPLMKFLSDNIDTVKKLMWAFIAWKVVMKIKAMVDAFVIGMTKIFIKMTALNTKMNALNTKIANQAFWRNAFKVGLVAAAIWATIEVVKAVSSMIAAVKATIDAEKSAEAEGDAISDAIKRINKAQKQGKISKKEAAAKIASFGTPGTTRALGGNVTEDKPVLVGEQGKEIFVPNRSGRVVPNHELSGNTTVNLNVNIGMFAGTPMERRKIAQTIWDDLQVLQSKTGTA